MNVQLVRVTNDNASVASLSMKFQCAAVSANGSAFEEFPCPLRTVSSSSDRVDSEGTERIKRSISYMEEHLDQPTKVSTLASMVHVSPSYFHALFKRFTGCAPMDYFTRLRMQRARELLESTCLSVKEIAAALGYDDAFYFSRVFKSVNRIAPSFYRQLPSGARDAEWSEDLLQPFPTRVAPAQQANGSEGGAIHVQQSAWTNRSCK